MASLLWWWEHDAWARLGMALVGALLAAIVLRVLAYAFLGRLAKRHPLTGDLFRRASAPMELPIPLLMLLAALRVLPEADVLRSFVLVQHLLVIALMVALTWLVLRCLWVLEFVAIRKYPLDVSDNLSARRVLTQVRVLRRTADVMVLMLGAS